MDQAKKIASKVSFRTQTGEINLFIYFVLLTAIPTILAAIYYIFVATNTYVSETKFSVYSNEPQPASIAEIGPLSQLTSSNIQSSSTEQLLIVAEYIGGYDMLKKLDEALDLKSIYSKSGVDWLSKLPKGASKEEFLSYFRKMVLMKVDRDASIILVTVKAFSAEDAHNIAKYISFFSEAFLNDMHDRIKKDVLMQSQSFIYKAQDKIKEIQNKLSDFRIKNTTLDPTEELNTKLEFIRALEVKKAGFLIEQNEKQGLLSASSIPMKTIKNKIENINDLIARTEKEVLKFSDEGGDILRYYSMLILDEEFAKEEYKLALLNLDETIKNQSRASKYIVEIMASTLPDTSTEPKRMYQIFTIFAMSFIAFGILSLIVAGIRDHIVT